ncbi:LOW QUALITY PROTEIN: adenylate kinase 8-like [Lethenteron reissneri]|uniref:adenylate kinase 8-like n=1 Tax=Lethenteron reissneri TaxID=7753 RepID=UPI002AB67418|nr:adenylate kinase 8-like [Lethenteron reissneri]XP_061434744.1 LOW QUALITY PROTEIN: adenylate kinase 8-like [Lethenteron reissneri]
MDATQRPLCVPPDLEVYAEAHGLFDICKNLLEQVLIHKPDDPIQFFIDAINRDNQDVPRILLLGPPASGKTTIARLACERLGAVHVSMDRLVSNTSSDFAGEVRRLKEIGQEVPPGLWVRLVQDRLTENDCIKQGWLIEDFPQTRPQALLLQEKGIAPRHVVMLDAPDAVLIERNQGKRVDPLTGDVYHATFAWPSEPSVRARLLAPPGISEERTAERLRCHRRDAWSVEACYPSYLRSVNADQPAPDLLAQVLTLVAERERPLGPGTARLLLLGPPGSGKDLQASRLALKYGLLNVSYRKLLLEAAAGESATGQAVKMHLESRRPVPDLLVAGLLAERLRGREATARGWVLHGPLHVAEQLALLQSDGIFPNRVFILDVPDDTAVERTSLRKTDPVTGERYHEIFRPAPDGAVWARCRQHPRDSEAEVRERLREFRSLVAPARLLHPRAVLVNADRDPHTVLEHLESRLVNALPVNALPANAREGD